MNPGSVVFDRYQLHEQVGAGGMGVVWRATDQLLNQPVALKCVPFTSPGMDPSHDRALREARVAAQLRAHPHVVSIYDVLVDERSVWLVMEYLPSRSLGELLQERGPLDPGEVARIGAHIADALAAGHSRGIEHRDVKPGNVLIGFDGTVKLTDFGISHLAGETRLTQTGIISGTVPYLAPEVAGKGEASSASDVFSLGSTLYAAVEGQPPFGTDDNAIKLLNIVRTGIIRPPTCAGPLQPLLLRLLQVDPATRPDAATVRDLLAQLATGATPPRGHPCLGARPIPDHAALTALTSPPRRRSTRRRITVAGGKLAALAAISIAAGLLIGVSMLTDPPAKPALPATVGPLSLTGDARAADSCALIDVEPLRQFGQPRITRSGSIEGCQASIEPSDDVESHLDVFFGGRTSSASALDGERQQLGDLTIVRQKFLPDPGSVGVAALCRNILVLTDRTTIYIDTYTYRLAKADLCAVTEVATITAVNTLARDGISYTPDRTSAYSIAHSDACNTLDDPALSTVPGLDPHVRLPGFANWSCFWGPATDGSPYVSLYFRLDEAVIGEYGEPITIAGKRAFRESSAGTYNPERCVVYVVHRAAATDTTATELFSITVDAPRPTEELCALATDFATVVATKLPMA